MSKQVHYKGKLKLVEKLGNETLDDQCKRLMNYEKLPSYYDDYKEFLLDENYQEYIIYKENLYEVEKVGVDENDIFNINKINDKEFEFEVSYYNGGCSFDEAIEESFKRLMRK